jgi:hypothetical protein
MLVLVVLPSGCGTATVTAGKRGRLESVASGADQHAGRNDNRHMAWP